MRRAPLECHTIETLPLVHPGDDLPALLARAIRSTGLTLAAYDIVAVCQKVVSKAEGRIVDLANVTPSAFATRIAESTGKDARIVEVILRESTRIVKMTSGHLICETGPGWICANAGVDESNAERPDSLTLLPHDADASAEALRARLSADAGGAPIGVVVTDTFGRPWRDGLLDVALGVAGIGAVLDYRGATDLGGRELHHTVIAQADAIAAAAGLLMVKGAGIPAVVLRGVSWERTTGRGRDLIRPAALDLFR
ncbi:MAG: coenzyme F420-0:L-glutamate ligase [Deltaproteobacteria bacterium]|nr:coenzyme F420-0:L-glutamate ligase [Deltaproteobacteria bacterium]